MKKSLFAMTAIVLVSLNIALGQRPAITGLVISKRDNQPIPGATVVVSSTSIGTVTSFDGSFQISPPSEAKTLTVSYIGMKPVEVQITQKEFYKIVLESHNVSVDEVVVTALGVSREKKALGYSVQNISGSNVGPGDQGNAVAQLSGKVAGVQISGSSSAIGGSTRVLIRGANSITGENQPLFVIDGVPLDNANYSESKDRPGGSGIDYGNMSQDINPEDIETISVLKGPSAAALYGSRAANGVIMITTKRGGKRPGLGVTIRSGVSVEKVNRLPKLQSQYGGGGLSSFDKVTIDGTPYATVAYHVDESWGPKFDPNQQVLHWDGLNPQDPDNYLKTRPWVAPENDIDKFFDTGVIFNNTISLSGSKEDSDFRLSFHSLNATGFLPNASSDKYTVTFNGRSKISEMIEITAGGSFINNQVTGRPVTGYSSNNVMLQLTQWGQRQLDYERLKNYKNEDGTHNPWNRTSALNPRAKYINNPYWIRNENYTEESRNRFIGNAGVTLRPTKSLSSTLKVYHDSYVFQNSDRMAVGSRHTPSYSETVRQFQENNVEWITQWQKQVGDDWSLDALVGGNIRKNKFYRTSGETQSGLFISGLYNTKNSVDPPIVDDYERHRLGYSVFGRLSAGYKRVLYVDVTARNDWSSTLPVENRSYFYPSVNGSFVFSSLPWFESSEVLSFGKVRAGWAKTGNDTDPYALSETYAITSPNFSGVAQYSVPDVLANGDLKAEVTYAKEVGLEAMFFNNRLGFDATLYWNRTEDLITKVALSGTSGYSHMFDNAGVMTNNGFELVLNATPVKTNNFSWDITVNYAKNNNKLVSLKEGINNYQMGVAPQNVTVNAFVGSSYGAILGTNYVYDDQGQRVVGIDGRYLETLAPEVIGSVLPDYNMGIQQQFRYKNVSLSALIDIQKGGNYYSISNLFGMSSGLLEETVYRNGVDIREHGLILDGVYGKFDADGNVVHVTKDNVTSSGAVANDTEITARQYGKDFRYGPDVQNIFDASYIKLREVTLSYQFPSRLTGPIQNLRFSIYGRNLYTWGLDNTNIDPEMAVTSSGNVQGIEGGALPSTANYGVNVQFSL
ncbi:SusC/RagA family TonB-linked outer membrane protein [Halosquirtibacter xylanolyticus]|uniref:SusC/RagA family TonB-linked outer membrane protein n=1 Tax=Halosquirtibacter xylanolyticus TaxID=3374599 RepID=UPI00374852C9|nr:SusC/RagA family TonB-linked outer membrane protein [Prolixibacteraceae bacterium]